MTAGSTSKESGPRAWDLVVAVLVTLVGAGAVWFLPTGNPLRFALALPVLLFTPGYLLLQVAVLPKPGRDRAVQPIVAVPASIAVVALLALATAVVPDGFTPTNIVAVVTSASLALAALAKARRNAASGGKVPASIHRGAPASDLPPVVYEPPVHPRATEPVPIVTASRPDPVPVSSVPVLLAPTMPEGEVAPPASVVAETVGLEARPVSPGAEPAVPTESRPATG
ncbi:MAG: DUF1616 domain-containing protein [Euryarchaeota archaeon]|nr:DUF1616 domain-containing protein [Euryarchaeota archaeon]